MKINYNINEIISIINRQLNNIDHEADIYKQLSKYTIVYSIPITEYLGDLMLILEELIIDNNINTLSETLDLYRSLCIVFNRKPLINTTNDNKTEIY